MAHPTGDFPFGASLCCPWRCAMLCMILGSGSGRCGRKVCAYFCPCLWPLWLRRLSQYCHAHSGCSKRPTSLLTWPRLPEYGSCRAGLHITSSPALASSEDMPRSQTPVVSCALARIAHRMVAFRCVHTVGVCRETAEAILLTTTLHIAGLHHAAGLLAHSSFVRPLLGWHGACAPDLLARLASGGTCTTRFSPTG